MQSNYTANLNGKPMPGKYRLGATQTDKYFTPNSLPRQYTGRHDEARITLWQYEHSRPAVVQAHS